MALQEPLIRANECPLRVKGVEISLPLDAAERLMIVLKKFNEESLTELFGNKTEAHSAHREIGQIIKVVREVLTETDKPDTIAA